MGRKGDWKVNAASFAAHWWVNAVCRATTSLDPAAVEPAFPAAPEGYLLKKPQNSFSWLKRYCAWDPNANRLNYWTSKKKKYDNRPPKGSFLQQDLIRVWHPDPQKLILFNVEFQDKFLAMRAETIKEAEGWLITHLTAQDRVHEFPVADSATTRNPAAPTNKKNYCSTFLFMSTALFIILYAACEREPPRSCQYVYSFTPAPQVPHPLSQGCAFEEMKPWLVHFNRPKQQRPDSPLGPFVSRFWISATIFHSPISTFSFRQPVRIRKSVQTLSSAEFFWVTEALRLLQTSTMAVLNGTVILLPQTAGGKMSIQLGHATLPGNDYPISFFEWFAGMHG
eukprot:g17990.t1